MTEPARTRTTPPIAAPPPAAHDELDDPRHEPLLRALEPRPVVTARDLRADNPLFADSVEFQRDDDASNWLLDANFGTGRSVDPRSQDRAWLTDRFRTGVDLLNGDKDRMVFALLAAGSLEVKRGEAAATLAVERCALGYRISLATSLGYGVGGEAKKPELFGDVVQAKASAKGLLSAGMRIEKIAATSDAAARAMCEMATATTFATMPHLSGAAERLLCGPKDGGAGLAAIEIEGGAAVEVGLALGARAMERIELTAGGFGWSLRGAVTARIELPNEREPRTIVRLGYETQGGRRFVAGATEVSSSESGNTLSLPALAQADSSEIRRHTLAWVLPTEVTRDALVRDPIGTLRAVKDRAARLEDRIEFSRQTLDACLARGRTLVEELSFTISPNASSDASDRADACWKAGPIRCPSNAEGKIEWSSSQVRSRGQKFDVGFSLPVAAKVSIGIESRHDEMEPLQR